MNRRQRERTPLVRAFDWTFRSRKTGRVTLGQSPNLSQKVFLGSAAVSLALPKGRLRTTSGKIATGALGVWAVGEVTSGVNPFRRMLGAVALLAIVLAWVAQQPGAHRGAQGRSAER